METRGYEGCEVVRYVARGAEGNSNQQQLFNSSHAASTLTEIDVRRMSAPRLRCTTAGTNTGEPSKARIC